MDSNSTPSSSSLTTNSNTTMKRQRVPQQTAEDYAAVGDIMFDPRRPQHSDASSGGIGATDLSAIPLQSMAGGRFGAAPQQHRNVLEAQVQDGDTLQAIAIRYRCSVAEIKRLNKIERDFEIHAHKTLQVPLTADNILADHLLLSGDPTTSTGDTHHQNHSQTAADNLLTDLASQSSTASARPAASFLNTEPSINEIILNTTIISNQYTDQRDAEGVDGEPTLYNDLQNAEQTLLINDDNVTQPRPIQAAGRLRAHDLSCSGSDCDLSWLCLFVFILAMCFAIPLIYVFWIAEHHVDTDDMLRLVALTEPNEHHDGGET